MNATSIHAHCVTVAVDPTELGHVAQSYVQVGKTEYRVDFENVQGISGQPDFEMITLTGPRGAVLMAGKFVNSENYHAWRTTGTYADLKNPATGRKASFKCDGYKLELI